MRRVRFRLDDEGPYDGMMCFGRVGDGEVEFIAITLPDAPLAGFQTITVIPEDDEPFEAPIKILMKAESRFDTECRLMSGYVVFETV